MIHNFELQLYNKLPMYWKTLVSAVGTPTDLVPYIFEALPATGEFGANQAAIGALFSKLTTGNTSSNMSFILQYPSTNAHVPCVSIEVQDESEDEVIGSFVYQDTSTAGTVIDYIGGPFIKRYSIGIWTWQPDTTLYVYSAIKYCLLDIRASFNDATTFHITARPMAVDADRFEEPVYVRYIDIVIEGVLDTVARTYGAVTQVTVDPTITQSDISISI
jgi:hypothetical protein